MKKLTLFAAFIMLIQGAFAGGLLTNTNQSAQFIRMMSRNASTEIDAVYFNPAGLIKLQDGWHFAAYSQTIFQDKTIESGYPLLNDGNYLGEVNVPVFPTAFAVYKKENWAFSLGFGPNAGGGSATFERGLPSFEIPITNLSYGLQRVAPLLSQYQIPAAAGYDADLSFEGSSVFWGIQLGATYQVNDILSVYGGVRYLPSKNSYTGSIKDITVTTQGDQAYSADQYIAMATPVLAQTATALNSASAGLQAAINAGMISGNDPVANPQIVAVLQAFGQSNLTNSQAIDFMSQTSQSLNAIVNADVSDKEVITEQTGAGFTPMVGINLSPSENFNIALKYEMKTTLTLTNETEVDDLGLYPDGGTVQNDIPALLGVGVGYKANDWLQAQLSYNMFFDKGVEWGPNVRDLAIYKSIDLTKIRTREIDNNGYEIALGLQFNLSDNFALSVGGMKSTMGIADSYQSDFSFSNPSVTAGAGFMYKITDKLTLDAGFSNTFYEDKTVSFIDPVAGEYNETYGKTTLNFAVGLSYSIFQ